jgi:hypothetical protein
VNPETNQLDPNTYTGKHWHSVPKGSQNGNYGGIRFLLDVESYAFAYMGKDSVGFRITFADAQDKPTVTQDAYLLSIKFYMANPPRGVTFVCWPLGK